jgi:potassium/chloride transporter 9
MSRRRPNFSTRTAEEDVTRLDPGDSAPGTSEEHRWFFPWHSTLWSRPDEPVNPSLGTTDGQHHSAPTNLFRGIAQWWDNRDHSTEAEESSRERVFHTGALRESSADKNHKHGHRVHSSDEPKKLGTLSGVFVPTTLNVLSILMFLRFGFILGQAGVLGILGM